MSEIESVEYVSDENIDKYAHILNGFNFSEDILEQEVNAYMISDESRFWHFGLDEDKLKHSLLYRFGIALAGSNEIIWKVLAQIEENLKEQIPADLYSFWAIPNLFCVSHSHPAKDYFRIKYLTQNIASTDFDTIIELRSKERDPGNKYNSMFGETLEELGKEVTRDIIIIADEAAFGIDEIEGLITKIDGYIANGKRFLFHSQGRTDRLALILAGWLVKHNLADDTNFIEKIARLREGFWADPGPDESEVVRQFNAYLRFNCDETRTFDRFTICKEKVRSMHVVPFSFSKERSKEISYWIHAQIRLNYDVDEENLALIRHFMANRIIFQDEHQIQVSKIIDTDTGSIGMR